MKKYRLLAIAAVFMIASCAVITVNVYFPEKDVQQAYKNLEKELMTGDKPAEPKKDETQPQTKPGAGLRFELVPSAYAQDAGMAEKIAETVRKMPDVVEAYRQIGAMIPDLDRIRDQGIAGEGNNGMLAMRGAGSPADKAFVDKVNANRSIVINGMARAIVRINRQPETPANLQQVLPQAAEQFATLRRDFAKKGWWIQDKYGNWNRK